MAIAFAPRVTTKPEQERPILVYWTLSLDARTACAELWPHPLGYELRILADDELRRSRVYRARADADQDAADTEARLTARGWQVRAPRR